MSHAIANPNCATLIRNKDVGKAIANRNSDARKI
jgi:hypothetical protein